MATRAERIKSQVDKRLLDVERQKEADRLRSSQLREVKEKEERVLNERRRTEKERLVRENQQGIKNTGVFDLFLELRDCGVLVYTRESIVHREVEKKGFFGSTIKKYDDIVPAVPAKVEFSENGKVCWIGFNYREWSTSRLSHECDTSMDYYSECDRLYAYIGLDGLLHVALGSDSMNVGNPDQLGGMIVGTDGGLEEVVVELLSKR